MELKLEVRRKFMNKVNNSRMISIPPYFLANMDALNCDYAILKVQDKDHIIMEVVRNE